jgi:hypothetical protein
MSLELFNRGKAPGCLSGWQVSQLTLGLLDGTAAAHARACEPCAARLQAEDRQCLAADSERVPAILLMRAGRSPWLSRIERRHVVGVATLALVLAVAGAVVGWLGYRLLTPRDWVVAAVSRGGSLLLHDIPADRLGPLHPGDKLRLRIVASRLKWARLESRHGDRWETYFEGPLPKDGWLPSGLTVAPAGKTQVRLWACPGPMTSEGVKVPSACRQQEIVL